MPKSFVPDASEWEDGMSAKVFFWFFGKRDDATRDVMADDR